MTNSKDTFTFNGFEPANTTPVPDVLFDELLSQLSGSELKTLLYIIRRTRGFKKDSDAISLSQFQKGIITKDGKQLDKGCGIDDRQTIINALASLEKKRCIVSEKCKTTKGDNATTVYRILFSQGVVGKPNQGSREKATTPVGNSNHRSGKKPTTVVGNSNPQETVLQDTVKQDTEEQEREIPPNTLDTHTIVSSDTAHTLPSKDEIPVTFSDCLSYLQEQGVAPRGEDAVQVMVQARTLYAHKHPRYEYRARPGLSEHPDDQWPSQQNEQVFTNDAPQGDDHTVPASGHPHRVGDVAARGVDGAGSPCQDRSLATPEAGPVLEAQEEIAQTPPTSMPAQSLPLPQDAQAALGTKWNAQAMVARACELRGKPFSDTARPKETKAAQKLFDRKTDLTEEEFERAFQHWDTQWWRETNGLFNLTDLAAVPKNKSEMRLIIALEKLALSKAITRQSGQIIPISGTKRYSSYDDPNFSSENDFYPVEGGSYAAASV